jgi:putative tryptophan/tyrosine transport system substrate-binding protein
VESAARLLNRTIQILKASTVGEIDTAISSFVTMRGGGLQVTGAPTFLNRRDHLLALTKAHSLPAIYENREFTAAGGLMSYGTSVPIVYRQIGVYAARILRGGQAGRAASAPTNEVRHCSQSEDRERAWH